MHIYNLNKYNTNMKKRFILILIFIFTLFNNPIKVSAENNYYARNYIVMDAYTHEVLEGKDINSSYSVASISKIMTAIIALESYDLFKVVVVNDIINTIEGSSLYLSIGDQITIIDLVYGLLLRSGNDAAVLIATNICKDISSFVVKMNQKAEEIGMKNTIFNNPSGLDIFDDGNISSCYDMALLMSYCLGNGLFCQIINTSTYYSPLKGVWTNKNKLLRQYAYCIGGKTGYTKKAKRTLINCAEKDNQRLIVVTLNCGSDFAFHKYLFEKYFNNYNYIVFLYKGKNYIDEYIIYSDKLIGLRLSKDTPLKGIKQYYINPITNELKIKYISYNGETYDGGTYKNIYVYI